MRRLIARLLFALLVVVVAGAGSLALFLRSSLPVTDGTLALPGLQKSVRVSRDAHGIPTIAAASEHDADFALGFLHAQDRLFEMDMTRRYGAGRLSELFGERTLGIDRTMRTLGLYRAAEAQLPGLAPEARAALDAYAAGVNAYLATRTGALPPEYYLLHARPEPWQPADSLVWGKIMDLQLTANFRGELLRARLLTRLSPDDLGVLFPPHPEDIPVVIGNAHAMLDPHMLDRLAASLPPGIGPQQASNNWVVDGAHSKSGKPLLANDPHLDFSAPGVWYLARIEIPGRDLAGVTAPGTPFLILGHNDHIAWGFTTTGGDVEDLFVERPDPADPSRYLAPDGPRPFITREEKIAVRGAAPVTVTVRETRHGPVISDLANYAAGGTVLALQTTWLGADDTTPDALWAMSRARNWDEFRGALKQFVAPQQNIVYADIDGNIGFIAPARIPVRASGDGWLPAKGWSGENDWTGTVPFDALPSLYNPAAGRVVTANNRIVPDDYPVFIARDWGPPFRALRIGALLDATPIATPDSFAAIQADNLSLPAKALLPLMLTIAPKDDASREAVARLGRWDGRMDRDKVEPLLFIAWLRELNRALLADKLGPVFQSYWSLRPETIRIILTVHRDWCGHDGDCGPVLQSALDAALSDLRQRYGANMDDWRWGRAHVADFSSAIWSNVPLIKDWLDLGIAADGGQDTVNAGAMFVGDTAAPFLDRHGPTLRMIVDLAAPDQARFMIAPGQSGNPLSPHWGDLARPWRDATSLTFGDNSSGGVLTLEPK